jgi:hypothetical protein
LFFGGCQAGAVEAVLIRGGGGGGGGGVGSGWCGWVRVEGIGHDVVVVVVVVVVCVRGKKGTRK